MYEHLLWSTNLSLKLSNQRFVYRSLLRGPRKYIVSSLQHLALSHIISFKEQTETAVACDLCFLNKKVVNTP